MTRKLREILVFGVLFALPFGAAFAVQPWAAALLCPVGVIGLLGLNESLGQMRWPGQGGLGGSSGRAAPHDRH